MKAKKISLKAQCKPTEHRFFAVDVTLRIVSPKPSKTVPAFAIVCEKCGVSRKLNAR